MTLKDRKWHPVLDLEPGPAAAASPILRAVLTAVPRSRENTLAHRLGHGAGDRGHRPVPLAATANAAASFGTDLRRDILSGKNRLSGRKHGGGGLRSALFTHRPGAARGNLVVPAAAGTSRLIILPLRKNLAWTRFFLSRRRASPELPRYPPRVLSFGIFLIERDVDGHREDLGHVSHRILEAEDLGEPLELGLEFPVRGESDIEYSRGRRFEKSR